MYKKLLGYKKDNDVRLKNVPYGAEIVERIYVMYFGGKTTRTISETLKAENIEISGKSFTFSSHMIENIRRQIDCDFLFYKIQIIKRGHRSNENQVKKAYLFCTQVKF